MYDKFQKKERVCVTIPQMREFAEHEISPSRVNLFAGAPKVARACPGVLETSSSNSVSKLRPSPA
jgi:hypothetical protein